MPSLSNYPDAPDSLTNPSAGNAQNSVTVPHAQQHAVVNDAIEAIQAELGTNPSGSSDSVKDRFIALEGIVTALGDTAFGAISDGSISTAKIADNAVTSDKLLNSSVTRNKILNGAVNEAKLADGSVSQDKVKAKAVGYSKVDDANWVHLKRTTNQTILATGGDYISWNSEIVDKGGYITVSSDTIAVPSGKGGLYHITFNINGFTANTNSYIRIETSAGDQIDAPVAANGIALASAILPVAAGQTIKGWVYNGTSGSETVQGVFIAVRLFANYT